MRHSNHKNSQEVIVQDGEAGIEVGQMTTPLTAEKMVLAVLAEATEPLYVGTIYDRVRARFGADAGSDGRINKGLAYATYGGSVRVNGFRRDKTYELVKRKTSEKTAPR